jgi:anaerobic selenocysteine-containing dehydrogenase
VLWGTAQFYAQRYQQQVRRAGYEGQGHLLGENLFNAILEGETAVPISSHTFDEIWTLVKHKDGKIHLDVPEMLAEMEQLATEEAYTREEFPFILAAGERRAYNANQIMRDPDWRRNDSEGALRIHPTDAAIAGVVDGQQAICESESGAVEVRVTFDRVQRRGFVSLPHGYGQEYPDMETEELVQFGPRLNLLTSSLHCDPLAKTPYHKYVPVRVQRLI